MEARLPTEKLQRAKELVSRWMAKKKATKHEIISLIGVLQHATKIVRSGRTFLSRMYQAAAKLQELHFYTRLNKEFTSDLCWWDLFLESWNGLSLLQCTNAQTPSTPEFFIQTDASGSWGCGAFFKGRWLQLKWSSQWSKVHIMAKEMLCLEQVLRGIKKEQTYRLPTKIRLSITIQIMRQIKKLQLQTSHDYNSILMWAVCCTAFFGFLR